MGIVEELRASRPQYSEPAPITQEHQLAAFDCGKLPLNDFLRRRALKNEGPASRTYVVASQTGTDAGQVVAFYSLAAGAVQRPDLPPKLARNMPNPTPLMVLGRMAVDLDHRGRHLGSGMLRHALQRCIEANQRFGAAAIIVHAIDADAVTFYTQFGFEEFPTGQRTLFLPMTRVIASLT